jgi:hypothetical protein
MPRWQRTYLAACTGLIGFAVAYVLCDYSEWSRLTYDQYARSWSLVDGRPVGLPSNYVGTVLWGIGGGVVGWAGGFAACSLFRREVPRGVMHLVGAWALTAFAYGGLYYTWSLWPF